MAELRLDRLSKRFGTTVVAEELSLVIGDGEFFVFLGPSGSGKSTLLHVIAGVEAPTAGRVWIGGVDVTGLPAQKRDVAMVFQSYALYPHLDVFGNLAFPLRTRGVGGEALRSEVARVAEMLGLGALLQRKPRELSGGQRQRVALGRALIRRPAAFLMDEPLSNLDAALRLEIREEIRRLHQAHHITTAYVTHDQEEAMALADRIAVLRDGRVQQCADPRELYARPANAFVARFVGSPPMNVVPGASLAGHGGLSVRVAGRDLARLSVGVRPHDCTIGATVAAGSIPVVVAVVEPGGPESWVVAEAHGARFRARLARGEALAPGDAAHLCFAAGAVHLFDAATGARIE